MRRLLVVLLLTVCAAHADVDPLDPSGAPAAVRRDLFRAETALEAGETDAAARLLADALAAGRDHPALHHRLAACLLELQRPDEALVHLRRAVELAPGSSAVRRDLARAAYEAGEYVAAAEAFVAADGLESDPVLRYYAGVAWSLAERYGEATEVLAPLIETSPTVVPREWIRALVSAAALDERPERADAAVARLLREQPDDPQAWLLAGRQSQLRDDPAGAAARLQVAHWLVPLDPVELRRLGDLYAAAGLPRPAARIYAELLPGDPSLVRPLAAAWQRAHEPDSARAVLAAVVEAEADAGLWVLLGDLEYEQGRWTAARAAYARAAALEPETGRNWLLQGACSVQLDDVAAARPALERALTSPDAAGQAARLLAYLDAADRTR